MYRDKASPFLGPGIKQIHSIRYLAEKGRVLTRATMLKYREGLWVINCGNAGATLSHVVSATASSMPLNGACHTTHEMPANVKLTIETLLSFGVQINSGPRRDMKNSLK